MKRRTLLTLLLFLAGAASADESTQVTDEASAIAAAKRYTKARCTETPCQYRVRREGKQWNVWVDFTKRSRPGAKPQPYHGGHVILYFNQQGQLVRRIQGE
jgi:hypothetical protein